MAFSSTDEVPRTSERSAADPIAPSTTTGTQDLSLEEDQLEGRFIARTTGNLLTGFCEPDTLVYVTGFLIHRLDCATCLDSMGQLVDKETAEGFLKEKLFEPSHLFKAKERIVNTLHAAIKPVTQFYDNNFYIDDIVKRTVELFPVNIPECCCDEHCKLFLLYFYRMLLRVFCRKKNSDTKSNTRSKLKKINVLV